jgi:two-component system NarL family response regulator
MEPTDKNRPIGVFLVDDHRLIREALRDTLAREPEVTVLGETGLGLAALDWVREHRPDVVVLDIGLPDLNGIEVAARIHEARVGTRIVALSAYADRRFVNEMLKAGASAFVSKASAGTELVVAIRAAAAGDSYLSLDVAGALVAQVRGEDAAAEARLGRREREVLRLVAQGMRSPVIAQTLHVSIATVEVHRRNIMRKLGLHSVADLTRYAVREGIVPP